MGLLHRIMQKVVASRIGKVSASSFRSMEHSVGHASQRAYEVYEAGKAVGMQAEHRMIDGVKGAEKAAGVYWKKLGPGLTTGAADDDPSGIATYSQTGAQTGFQFTWLALFTYPLMAVVQEMCARIGLVTSRGLAANIRLHFPPWMLYGLTVLLFVANVFNIGADLGAMAEAGRLIVPQIPFYIWVIVFTGFSLFLQIFTSYKSYAKYLKWLALILFSYVIAGFLIDINWREVAWVTLVPHMDFSKDSIILIAAILGTTISPYLFFWQTSQEVEERILHGQVIEGHIEVIKTMSEEGAVIATEAVTDKEVVPLPVITEVSEVELKDMRIDVWSGMFISNLVMFFIIVVCSAMLHANGITTIQTAADAANALRPLAGHFAYLLFAIGIIGTGLLAVPILAGSTSYAIAESFKWTSGLHYKLREAYAFYAVIIASMLIGLGINFIGLDPIKALIYSAVVNCLVAPLVLVLIVLISANKEVMGKHANSKLTNMFGWLVTVFMCIVAIATIWSIL